MKALDDGRPHKAETTYKYCSYLLRFWWDGTDSGWRASLEETAGGQKRFFASFDALVGFLDQKLHHTDGQDGQ